MRYRRLARVTPRVASQCQPRAKARFAEREAGSAMFVPVLIWLACFANHNHRCFGVIYSQREYAMR